jgi:hypothetical protein
MSRGPALAPHRGMTNLDLDTLVTVMGGTATVAGAKQLDTQTEAALTKLASDVKDLAKAPANSQMNQLMTVMMMSRMMSR